MVTKQDLINYILKAGASFNGNVFGPMLDEYAEIPDNYVELPEGYEDTVACKGENASQFFADGTYLYWDSDDGKLKIGEGTYVEPSDEPEAPETAE